MTLFNRKQPQPEPEQPSIDTSTAVEPTPEPEPAQPQYLFTRSGERIVYNQQLQPVILQVSSGINLQPLEVLTDTQGNSYQFVYALPTKHHEFIHLLCVPV